MCLTLKFNILTMTLKFNILTNGNFHFAPLIASLPYSSSSHFPAIHKTYHTQSAQVGRLHWQDVPFERLDVSAAVADDIFRDDEFKRLQIPSIVEKSRQRKEKLQAQRTAKAAAEAKKNKDNADDEAKNPKLIEFEPEGTVTCYRLGDHVDISTGVCVCVCVCDECVMSV